MIPPRSLEAGTSARDQNPQWTGLEAMEPRLLLSAKAPIQLRINNSSGVEGTLADPGQVVFQVRRLGAQNVKSVVKYRTIMLTGNPDHAVWGDDFHYAQGRLVFKKGQKNQYIVVNLIGNDDPNNTKVFGVQLFKPKNAKVTKAYAVGYILDNNSASPSLSINDVQVVEGNSGTKTVFFTVTLSKVHNQVVTVDYKSSAGTATAPEDYIAVPLQTLTFNIGETVKSIAVQIVGDTIEAKRLFEEFYITLTNPSNATLGKAVGVGTIEDNDGKWA